MQKHKMKTAPTDGSWVLLWGGETEESGDDMTDGVDDKRPVVAKWIGWREYGRTEGGWVYANWDGRWRSFYVHPTHWSPLR